MLRFWLNRGVSGFRIDAVPHLFEVRATDKGRLPDEPLSGNTKDPEDYGYLNHIFTVDQPETIGSNNIFTIKNVFFRIIEKNCLNFRHGLSVASSFR